MDLSLNFLESVEAWLSENVYSHQGGGGGGASEESKIHNPRLFSGKIHDPHALIHKIQIYGF